MSSSSSPLSPDSAAGLATSRFSTGAVIGGRYRLLRLLGRGAMAEVWHAQHLRLQTEVALKVVDTEGKKDGAEMLQRFIREAQAIARLDNPHVVRILDYAVDGGRAFLAMQLLAGESLRHRLNRLGTLPYVQLAQIIAQLAEGLASAHAAGIVHRDIKPQNVYLANDGGYQVVKLLDFGVAKRVDAIKVDTLATQAGVLVGTPSYMSPEQILGTRQIDARSDLWQLGVLSFEALCGRRPFDDRAVGELMVRICSGRAPLPSQLRPVPDGFDEWFATATQKDPDHRFQSAQQLATALCAVLAPHAGYHELATTPVPWIDLPRQATAKPAIEPGTIRTTDPFATMSQRQALFIAVAVALAVAIPSVLAIVWLTPTEPGSQAGTGGTDAGAAHPWLVPTGDGPGANTSMAANSAGLEATSQTLDKADSQAGVPTPPTPSAPSSRPADASDRRTGNPSTNPRVW